jgi:hypothetical protein
MPTLVRCQKSIVAVTSGSGLTQGYDVIVCSPSSAEVPVVWSFVYPALRCVLEYRPLPRTTLTRSSRTALGLFFQSK